MTQDTLDRAPTSAPPSPFRRVAKSITTLIAPPPVTSNVLSIFDFKSFAIRTATKDGECWFSAADVCFALDISESIVDQMDESEARPLHAEYIAKTGNVVEPNVETEMLFVSEAGLYRTIFASKTATAKEFQQWVFRDVLPSIRKTGRYAMSAEHRDRLTDHVTDLLEVAQTEDPRVALYEKYFATMHDFSLEEVRLILRMKPVTFNEYLAAARWANVKRRAGAAYDLRIKHGDLIYKINPQSDAVELRFTSQGLNKICEDLGEPDPMIDYWTRRIQLLAGVAPKRNTTPGKYAVTVVYEVDAETEVEAKARMEHFHHDTKHVKFAYVLDVN